MGFLCQAYSCNILPAIHKLVVQVTEAGWEDLGDEGEMVTQEVTTSGLVNGLEYRKVGGGRNQGWLLGSWLAHRLADAAVPLLREY